MFEISTAATVRKRGASRESRSIIRAAKRNLKIIGKALSTPGREFDRTQFSSFVVLCVNLCNRCGGNGSQTL